MQYGVIVYIVGGLMGAAVTLIILKSWRYRVWGLATSGAMVGYGLYQLFGG